jgi:three-Cys-motif partner protein
MASTSFFTEQTEQSRTKARIVAKYFDGWSNVMAPIAMKRGELLQYIDLFSGPGRYEDGSKSTPLLVLDTAIRKRKLHDLLVCVFNDADPDNANALRTAIDSMPGINSLKHRPEVHCLPVDDQIVGMLENTALVPTLTFIDPFGFKSLSMRLIQATLKDWGCDCVFFFNFNRVNAAIHNDSVEEHITALFEVEAAHVLRERLRGKQADEREAAVTEELAAAIKRKHAKYVLHFSFANDRGTRTSHHLVFATKHSRGWQIMKDIMAKESSWTEGGLPSFRCTPKPRQITLFDDLDDPVAELEMMLLETFAGKVLTVAAIYEEHGVNKRYMLSHYKEALRRLEAAGQVTATPSAANRRVNTMADRTVIEFPKRDDEEGARGNPRHHS